MTRAQKRLGLNILGTPCMYGASLSSRIDTLRPSLPSLPSVRAMEDELWDQSNM